MTALRSLVSSLTAGLVTAVLVGSGLATGAPAVKDSPWDAAGQSSGATV